eukprot:TRINITY_DN47922_c0_g1_i1.p1 TRINITY_DN47922_c0_g1~~TRINITY_DN47922_c0_g1_i1.p1  ORF type:complete len:208 (+),score=33.26 TRINITY_DN47922_c0_g1_i1:40-663(+)
MAQSAPQLSQHAPAMPDQGSPKVSPTSLANASRTDLPWAAQMAVIRGSSRDKRERLQEDEIEVPGVAFQRAISAPARSTPAKLKLTKKVSPWQEADPGKNKKKMVFTRSHSGGETVGADLAESHFRQDNRMFNVDSDGDCEEAFKPRFARRAPEHPTCNMFSYSIDGKPSDSFAWPFQCAMPSTWCTEKLLFKEDTHMDSKVYRQSV